jgi:hypothetical protein
MAKTKFGMDVCPVCGEGVVWKIADGGSLSFTCQHCDFRAYAPAHCDSNKIIGAKFASTKPVPAPEGVDPVPAPKPKAAPKAKPAGIWDHLVKGAAA